LERFKTNGYAFFELYNFVHYRILLLSQKFRRNCMKDFRSDTVTKPCDAMRKKMALAEVGDDVFGDDPTVNQLQETAAELTGQEAALFAPSGTQTNLIGLLSHCQRGDEYIVGQDAHTYKYEAGGAAVLGSIQPQPIDFAEDGSLPINKIAAKIKPKDHHFANTNLVSIENTVHGQVLPMSYMSDIRAFTREKGLLLHLDGARVFNAAVALQRPLKDITSELDSVSICLSKGLGAPVGSLICGNKDFIERAHKWRKMVGGGMRQAGILAAAGLFALEHNINRLEQDHANARLLGELVSSIDELSVVSVQTNMLFIELGQFERHQVQEYMAKQGYHILAMNPLRIVMHKDVNEKDVQGLAEALKRMVIELN
jgi:threonine aldolase